jgi:hypothetical protein
MPILPASLHLLWVHTSNVKNLQQTKGHFLVYRGSWAPLRPTFWLKNLPLWSTELYKKLGAKVMKIWLQKRKSWASRIALNSLWTRNRPQMALYTISLLLYKVFNNTASGNDQFHFNNQIICTGSQSTFEFHKSNNNKIGINILSSKFTCITWKIQLNLFICIYPLYK